MMGVLIQEIEACQRCGSSDLSIEDLDFGKSSFGRILRCKTCGLDVLIPRREAPKRTESSQAIHETPTKKDWRVLME
ncbi:MAG: hypothetical protein M1518_02015 [Candidatus Thermoplasmatota archaeon]|nr:hypothetical protein [Candidatus Thermoplasmatota archaeon]